MSEDNKCPCFLAHTDSCKLSKMEKKHDLFEEQHILSESKIHEQQKTEIAKLKEKYIYLEDRYKESGGLRCLRDRGLIKEVLQELNELIRGLVSDLQDSNSLSKATIKCYEGKLIKNLEKLDVGSARQTEKKACFNCGHLTGTHLTDLNCNDRDMNSYKEFIYTTFKTGICNNWIKDSKTEKKSFFRWTLKQLEEFHEFYLQHLDSVSMGALLGDIEGLIKGMKASGGDLDKILVIRDDLLKLYNIASYYRPNNEDLNKIRKRIKELYEIG